jgi:DNA-binding beta-propeller fold protein YncE
MGNAECRMRNAESGGALLRRVAYSAFCILHSAFLLPGCTKPAGQIFAPGGHALVWPGPPERARVRYVGQLATSADLKPAVPFGQQVGEAMFGRGAVQSMLTPYALCTDGADRLFVADTNAQVVHVFDLRTRKYARWAPANSDKRFAQPVGVAWDPSGNRLFVADSVGECLHAFDTDGKYLGEFGRGWVTRPAGLAFDARANRLYAADVGGHRVVIFSPEGNHLAHFGTRGTAPGQFNFPTNVAVDSRGRVYVSDSLNFRVQQFGPDFAPLRQIGRKGDVPGTFGQPKGLATDADGHLYVVDANFEAVQIFDDQGRLLLDFGQEGQGPGAFWLPAGIFIDATNRVWVADSYNRRVQVFEYLPERADSPPLQPGPKP